ncbi:MAG: tetratricopeptide repeat protein [Allorhizobium sp.]
MRKALSIDPACTEAQVALAQLLAETGEVADAQTM